MPQPQRHHSAGKLTINARLYHQRQGLLSTILIFNLTYIQTPNYTLYKNHPIFIFISPQGRCIKVNSYLYNLSNIYLIDQLSSIFTTNMIGYD